MVNVSIRTSQLNIYKRLTTYLLVYKLVLSISKNPHHLGQKERRGKRRRRGVDGVRVGDFEDWSRRLFSRKDILCNKVLLLYLHEKK